MKTHLFLCTGPTCSQQGAEETLQSLQAVLGDRNLHTKVRVTLCRCLGQCGNGPNMVVYPEGVWYGHAEKEKIGQIVQEHLVGGTPISALVLTPVD